MTLATDSPIEALKLPKVAVSTLTNHNIRTVAALTAHSRAYYAGLVWLRQYLPDIDAALAQHGLDYAPDGGRPNQCKTCTTCQDCGGLRAVDARNVVTDYRGRAKHNGFADAAPCESCDEYHRDLVATRTAELVGSI